jgi:histidyl-tRNA synthetase
MKRADKLRARVAVLFGADELARGVWTVRDMGASSQEAVEDARLVEHLKEKLNG